MISLNSIENFKPVFSVVSCFVEHGDEILILKRNPDKPQVESWGLPSGKIDEEETELEAIKRELYEEVGIETPTESLRIEKKCSLDMMIMILFSTLILYPSQKKLMLS